MKLELELKSRVAATKINGATSAGSLCPSSSLILPIGVFASEALSRHSQDKWNGLASCTTFQVPAGTRGRHTRSREGSLLPSSTFHC